MVNSIELIANTNQVWTSSNTNLDHFTRFESASYYYQADTAETHFISAFHDEIFDYIDTHDNATTQQISQYIADICEEPVSKQWEERIQYSLIELATIGLIRHGSDHETC